MQSIIPKNKQMEEAVQKAFIGSDPTDSRATNVDVPNPIAPEGTAYPRREIRIRQLNAGYVVDVGCHSFAITSKTDLIEYLAAYIKDPKSTEKKWFNGELFQE